MAYLLGAVLAFMVCGVATIVRIDRDRAFYPKLTVVIALFYALFAVMGGSMRALMQESVVIAGFVLIAIIGFKRSLWLIVVALAAHGVFDVLHDNVIANPGVPAWWPPVCLAYDVVTAAYLAMLLLRRRVNPSPAAGAAPPV
jgi:hypothetical protein